MKVLNMIQQGDVWIEKIDTFVGVPYKIWIEKKVDTLIGVPYKIKNQYVDWIDKTIDDLTEPRLNEKAPVENAILAAGEVTGHHHRLLTENPAIKINMDLGIFELMEKAVLSHEEHLPLELEPGLYRFGIIHEWDYDKQEKRYVWD